MNPFVGVKQVNSSDDLRKLLDKFAKKPTYYFLRWQDRVSGIVEDLKDFPSPEGQMFNGDRELRWKQQGQGYSVLLLSITDRDSSFNSIDEERDKKIEWQVEQRPAYIYRPDETRFPQKFIVPDALNPIIKDEKNNPNKVKLAQRYFIDRETSTVHFIALIVEISP
ncbi:hypothetical protein H6S82_10335 [Planktothrix sp. FACHB-1355]|uniref:Uncharacterized protein n=1 Tax=Aerosakkonema funiforme FACHB-1375 TaxID=2949571 RepID=A0A926ZGM4_9CYAN|nr:MULTISPECIES: hypothetical protein [Oscillatoriales]MBD2182393.1 hypothetical protein [Aerosakkonema funiforme FACHB-1375]MBD3559257.1 hypothetical protein [Planktothrix sp. FACHB-1355]